MSRKIQTKSNNEYIVRLNKIYWTLEGKYVTALNVVY